jgi:hypothetical protein
MIYGVFEAISAYTLFCIMIQRLFYIFTIFAIGNKIACGDTLISEYILRLTYSSRH